MKKTQSDRLYDLFVLPILKSRPSNMDETDYLNFILHVHSRPISWYVVKKPCLVKGLKLDGAHWASDQLSGRQLNKGDQLLIRLDEVTGVVHVEKHGSVFQLYLTEWQQLRLMLKLGKNSEEL